MSASISTEERQKGDHQSETQTFMHLQQKSRGTTSSEEPCEPYPGRRKNYGLHQDTAKGTSPTELPLHFRSPEMVVHDCLPPANELAFIVSTSWKMIYLNHLVHDDTFDLGCSVHFSVSDEALLKTSDLGRESHADL